MECFHCDKSLVSKPFQMKILHSNKPFIFCIDCWKLAIHGDYDLKFNCDECGIGTYCIPRSIADISFRLMNNRDND